MTKLKLGDKVRVRKWVAEPRCGWGGVSHKSVGVIRKIDGERLVIGFREHQSWNGYTDEVEKVITFLENK